MLFQKSLNLNIFLMKLVGAWPRESFNKPANFAYLAFIVCFFLIPVSCFPMLYIYLNENTDLIKISQTAFMSCELTLIAPKIIYLLFNHEKLSELVCYWDSYVFQSISPSKTNELISKMTEQARKLTMWFTLLCVTAAITWAAKPFQNLSCKTLPADMWLPFDPFKDDVRYVLTFLHSFVACVLCAISNATIDTTFCNLLQHATVQLQMLKEALSNLGESESELDLKDGLKKCVLHYSAIVKFVRRVESIFNFTLFIQVFGSTVVICFSSFMMTVFPVNSLEFLALFVYMMCIVGELFLLCYYGTVIYEESANIIEAVYLGDWVNYDKSTKKGLLILMERTKRPMKLFAGGIIEISLATFTTVLRRAYSLFAVLKNMK